MTSPVTIRRAALLAALALSLGGLGACGSTSKPAGGAASTSPADGRTAAGAGSALTVDISTPPASLDPAAVCSIEDLGLLSDLYVTLLKTGTTRGPGGVEVEDQSKIEPYLAQSWKASDDGKTYTFKLRTDAKFPSGAPTDAAAVKYSFERAKGIGSCGANFLNASEPTTLIRSIETPDAHTVVIHLAHPQVNFLRALTNTATAIVDPTVLEQHGSTKQANAWLASHSAGSGPYALASYVAGTKAVYRANPTWFGADKALARTVNINFISNDATLLLQARNRQADVTLGLSKRSVASLKPDKSLKVLSIPAAAWQLISFPTKQAPFDNADLRRALTYAVPYQDILDKVAYGYGQLYYGPFPPVFSEYDKSLAGPRQLDTAKAKSLIAASGAKAPITFPLYIREGVAEQQQIATIVQSAWKPLGVDVKIKQLSAAAYQNAVAAKRKTYGLIRFDGPSITNAGWLATYDLLSTSLFNASNYDDPKTDELVQRALRVSDPAQAAPLWREVTQRWVAAAPRIPVYAQNYTPVLKADVTHFVYANSLLWFHLWGR